MNESTTTARFLELMRGGAGADASTTPVDDASTDRREQDVEGAVATVTATVEDHTSAASDHAPVSSADDGAPVETDVTGRDVPDAAARDAYDDDAQTRAGDDAPKTDGKIEGDGAHRENDGGRRPVANRSGDAAGVEPTTGDRAEAYAAMLRVVKRDQVTLGVLNQRLGARQSPGMKYVLQGERPPSDATLNTLSTALGVPLGFKTDPKADTDMRHYVGMDATHLSDVMKERLRDVAAGGRGVEMDAVRRLQGLAPIGPTPTSSRPEGAATSSDATSARNDVPTSGGARSAREFRREDASERARLHAAVLRALTSDPRGTSTKFRAARVGRENEKEIVAGTVGLGNAALEKFAAVYGIAHELDLSGLAGTEERDSVLAAGTEAKAPARATEAIPSGTTPTSPREGTASEETSSPTPSSPVADMAMSAPSPARSDDDLVGRVVELVRRAADAEARVAAAEAERDRMKAERDAMEGDLRDATDRLEALRRKVSEALG